MKAVYAYCLSLYKERRNNYNPRCLGARKALAVRSSVNKPILRRELEVQFLVFPLNVALYEWQEESLV